MSLIQPAATAQTIDRIRVQQTTPQSVATATATVLTVGESTVETSGDAPTVASDRVTFGATHVGPWDFWGRSQIDYPGSGTSWTEQLRFVHRDSEDAVKQYWSAGRSRSYTGSSTSIDHMVSASLLIEDGDYVQLEQFQTSGTTRTVSNAQILCAKRN